jgi:non-ribosomal peptide synthetase component F
MDGDPSFRDVLRRVRAAALEAYENSDVPFQELVRVLKPDPRSLRSPFFQVMFGFDSDMAARPSSFLHIDTKPGTARFDLILQLSENPDGVSGSFEYCTDLFDESMIAHLADEFVALLGTVSTDPDRPISNLEIDSAVVDEVTEPNTSQQDAPKSWKEIVQRLAERLTHRA